MEKKLIICKHTNEKGDGYYANTTILKNTLLFKEKIAICISKKQKNQSILPFWLIHLVYQNKKLKKLFLSTFVPNKIDDNCVSIEKIKNMIKDVETQKIKKFLDNLDSEEIIIAYEKIKRNCFDCDGKFFIAFDGTKFNHKCDANVDYYFDKDTNMLSFYTNRNILEGDELTIQYVNPLIAKSTLYNTYGFCCNCSMCK